MLLDEGALKHVNGVNFWNTLLHLY